VDAIVAAAQIVTALQTVVSRNIAPTASGVVTVGTISGGTKENIIADRVTMTGTIRALEPQTQEQLKAAVRRIAQHTAEAHGAAAQVEMADLCPALINNGPLTEKLYALSQEILGKERTVQMRAPSLGADDFAFFSDAVPGCYFNVGAHTDELAGQSLHSPTFAPHEASLETALLLLTAAAVSE
jgi:amidohydrolase